MNIRICSGAIRFRITDEEMKILCKEKDAHLLEEIFLPGGWSIITEVRIFDSRVESERGLLLTTEANKIILSVSSDLLKKLAIPSKMGIVGEQAVNGKILKYSLEVDLKK